MFVNPKTISTPATDVEFLASRHLTTKAVTIDETFVRAGLYETNRKQVKAGTILGKVTASGLYAPVKKTTLAANALSTDTTITVADATFFQAGDEIDVNGTTATIDSINYGTNVITLTAQLGAAKNSGDVVKATNGLGTADCIQLNTLDLTREDLTHADAAATAVTHGVVHEARVRGANSLTKADLTRIEFR